MPKIKVLVGLISSEAILFGVQMSVCSLCSHMDFSLCMYIPGIFSFSHNDKSIVLGSQYMISSNLFNFLKSLSSPNMVILGVRDSTYKLGGTKFSS